MREVIRQSPQSQPVTMPLPHWYDSPSLTELSEPDPVDARDVEFLQSLAKMHGQFEGFIVGFGLALFLGLCAWLS